MNSPVVKAASVLGFCVALGVAPVSPAQVIRGSQAIVDGVEMDLGVMRARAVSDLPAAGMTEHAMHRGVPDRADTYHVNLSLFDSATHAQIRDAEVEATVEPLGMGGETKRLEPMSINHFVSYGNYFEMPGHDPYRISFVVHRGGAPVTRATFEYRHE